MKGKVKFKEILKVECFDKDGNLKWTEDNLTTKEITDEEYKIKEKQNDS